MRVKCAWCQASLGVKAPFQDNSITHGICKSCKDKWIIKASETTLHTIGWKGPKND